MVEPTSMELFRGARTAARCVKSRARRRQLGPVLPPDGKRILFSSNHATGRFPFNIYMVDVTGENLTQITYDERLTASPCSPDGTKLAFSSNRNNGRTATPTFSWRIGSSDADLRSMGD